MPFYCFTKTKIGQLHAGDPFIHLPDSGSVRMIGTFPPPIPVRHTRKHPVPTISNPQGKPEENNYVIYGRFLLN